MKKRKEKKRQVGLFAITNSIATMLEFLDAWDKNDKLLPSVMIKPLPFVWIAKLGNPPQHNTFAKDDLSLEVKMTWWPSK